ncbi:uncharacterized protein LOC143688348 isoform X2 [Tamandua tetradactyla]
MTERRPHSAKWGVGPPRRCVPPERPEARATARTRRTCSLSGRSDLGMRGARLTVGRTTAAGGCGPAPTGNCGDGSRLVPSPSDSWAWLILFTYFPSVSS